MKNPHRPQADGLPFKTVTHRDLGEIDSFYFAEPLDASWSSHRTLKDVTGSVEKAFLDKNPLFTDVIDIALGRTTFSDPRDGAGYYEPTAGGFDTSHINASGLSRFDLNNDGRADQYALKLAKTSINKEVEITKLAPTKLVPTSESGTVVVGKGDVSTTWVLRKEDTHSTAEAMTYNNEVGGKVSASGKLFGVGVSTEFHASHSFGGSTTKTDSFSVANEVRHTHSIPAGAYKEGTQVKYGYHILKGDVEVTEEVVSLFEITNAVRGTPNLLYVTGDTKSTLNDFALSLVSTDYDVNAQPDYSHLGYDLTLA